MNLKTYRALNDKAMKIIEAKENCQPEYLADPKRAEQELFDARKHLMAYRKVFDISVYNFFDDFSNYVGAFELEGVYGVTLKVDNLRIEVSDFESQFEARKDEKLLAQEVHFDYVLYDVLFGNKIGKLASGCIGMLANSESLLYDEQTAKQVAMMPKTLKNTRLNLVESDCIFSANTIFNMSAKRHEFTVNNISKSAQANFNDAAWYIIEQHINRKRNEKIAKIENQIDELVKEKEEVSSDTLEMVK